MWKLLIRNSRGKWIECWTYGEKRYADHDAAVIKRLHKSWRIEVMSAQSLALTRL
jgi:hypothetical protein